VSEPLQPTAPIAPAVVLPDDPALALALAQRLLVEPRMANHSFGLWGYSGRTQSGAELTVQSSGIGAASLVAVVEGLAGHGARAVVRVGRCRSRGAVPAPASRLVAGAAIASDGTSIALGGRGRIAADAALSEALIASAGAPSAVVAGADLGTVSRDREAAADADAFDLETAALYALAARLGIGVAAALVVTECATGARIDPEHAETSLLELGDAAGMALTEAAGEPAAAVG
jgi:uridine phosphorylase